MLAEFASVVDAMRCAAECSAAMIDASRKGRRPQIRFSHRINLGDVIARAATSSATASMSRHGSKRSRSRRDLRLATVRDHIRD